MRPSHHGKRNRHGNVTEANGYLWSDEYLVRATSALHCNTRPKLHSAGKSSSEPAEKIYEDFLDGRHQLFDIGDDSWLRDILKIQQKIRPLSGSPISDSFDVIVFLQCLHFIFCTSHSHHLWQNLVVF
jgi:hypothetical protein